MILTRATVEEMAEHERRRKMTPSDPWPLVAVVWFERAGRLEHDRIPLEARLAAAKPEDFHLWRNLALFLRWLGLP